MAASHGLATPARARIPGLLRALFRLARDHRGVAAIEFAVVGPVLLMILLGTISVSLLFNNYLELSSGVGAASLALAEARGTAAPYTTARNTLSASVPNLTTAKIGVTLMVAGTPCTDDSSCAGLLNANVGRPASVAVTYPCSLKVMGVDYAPGCTLRSQTTQVVQ